jgi:SAM-dependent methyltransferase
MSAEEHYAYCGAELALFAQARNWKTYWASRVAPHLGPEVLEVGAGIGATTQVLCDGRACRWLCLEPDVQMADGLRTTPLPPCCEVRTGTLAALKPNETFDAILYIDVLEHIADDRAELTAAITHLKPGGKLIVLSPAHPWLYSPFDKALGHHRRYTRRMLTAAVPAGLERVELIYLDSVGLLASTGNRLLLRRSLPSPRQIRIWDRLMVPLSRVLDPLFRYRVGKSVLGVWQRLPPSPER